MKIRFALFAGMVGTALLVGTAANATVLYSDGAVNGTNDALTFNNGFSVADSFTLTNPSTVTGLVFDTWNLPGDTLNNVEWDILSAEPGNSPTTLFSGVAPSTQSDVAGLDPNNYGYDVEQQQISVGSDPLAAGTYWIELSSASASNGDPIYWDLNGGPSGSWESDVGDMSTTANCQNAGFDNSGNNQCAEAFSVIGTTGAVPEPSSLPMLLAGLGLIGGALYFGRKKAIVRT